jgi:hypothetical protein
MTTDEALEGITDEGAFELLITAILGLAEPEYQRLIHVGINAQGKTIRSPVDGIVPAGADQKNRGHGHLRRPQRRNSGGNGLVPGLEMSPKALPH